MGSHRRQAAHGSDRRTRTRGTRITVLSAATFTAAAALAAVPAGAAPPPAPADARSELDGLYRQAERATEAYDRATEKVDRLTARVSSAQDRLARGQQRINTLRGALGALAGAQYRSGGLDPAVRLFLSSGPDRYLDRADTLDRAGARAAARLRQYRTLVRHAAQDREEARRTLAELRRGRAAVARHKHTVEQKLTAARRLLQKLPDAEREAYTHPAPAQAHAAAPSAPPPSARAAAAFAAARSALGRPYVWGANGPAGFDCSGLMQWAYAQAGVGLPRTSQEQRFAGTRVPLAQARPGDLVAYRSDASHIAMYAGHGQVIHAPHPGAAVRYDPVGMLPVSSVTRV